jgi:CRP-like cAMP-binding protein
MISKDLLNKYPKLESLIKGMPIRIKNKISIISYKPESVIFYKGDFLDKVYLQFDGEVKITNTFDDGYLYEVGRVDFPNVLGDQTVLSGYNLAEVTVTTVTDCKFIIINEKDYIEWIKEDSNYSFYLIKQMSQRAYPNSVNLGVRGYLNKTQLLENFFIMLATESNTFPIVINKKREELAYCVGISLRSLQRGLAQLKKENLIRVEGRKIIISEEQVNEILLNKV